MLPIGAVIVRELKRAIVKIMAIRMMLELDNVPIFVEASHYLPRLSVWP
jgi:hypothetical protein